MTTRYAFAVMALLLLSAGPVQARQTQLPDSLFTVTKGADVLFKVNANGSVALGTNSVASGEASFAAGEETIASGRNSVALGYRADTNSHDYSFVFSGQDSDYTQARRSNSAVWETRNGFTISTAWGGVSFGGNTGFWDQGGLINTSSGAHLTAGGAWTNSS